VTVGTNTADSPVEFIGGRVVFSTGTPSCVGSSSAPCLYTVKSLDLEIGQFVLGTHDAERMTVSGLRLFLEASVEAEDRGTGAMLPAGTRFHACMEVAGNGQTSSSALSNPLFMTIAPTEQLLTLDGTVDFEVRLASADCAARKLTSNFMLSGSKPWSVVPDGG
jgi:hypothetical protein